MKKSIITSVALFAAMSFNAQTNWKVDGSHSKLGFSVVHMMVAETEGKFKVYEGSVESKSETEAKAEAEEETEAEKKAKAEKEAKKETKILAEKKIQKKQKLLMVLKMLWKNVLSIQTRFFGMVNDFDTKRSPSLKQVKYNLLIKY
jgi:hypothetical protein